MERVRVDLFAVFSEMWKSRPKASDEYSDEADKEQEEELIALVPNISMELIKALHWCKSFSKNFYKEIVKKTNNSFRSENKSKGFIYVRIDIPRMGSLLAISRTCKIRICNSKNCRRYCIYTSIYFYLHDVALQRKM